MELWFLFCATLGILMNVVEARQMCWACQWQTNSIGKECLTAPANWTSGIPRMRCPQLCRTEARFDSKGVPTFISRSCGYYSKHNKDGCQRTPTMDICVFTCGHGDFYCNDRPLAKSPYKDPHHHGNGAALSLSMGYLGVMFALASHIVYSYCLQ